MAPAELTVTLPPREIIERSLLKALVRVYVAFALVAAVAAAILALNHNPSMAIGVLAGIGVITLIGVFETPLIMRSQKRRQQLLMRSVPSGGLYAGKASLLPSAGKLQLPVDGTILLSSSGVRFSREVLGPAVLELPWGEVSRIELKPQPGTVGVGTLTLHLVEGGGKRFTVPRYAALCRVLSAQS